MKVNFYATLREIVGQKTVEFEYLEGETVGKLIELMVNRFPLLSRELLDEKGELLGHVHVFVNGRDVPYLEKQADTALQVDDVISVFPAVGGG